MIKSLLPAVLALLGAAAPARAADFDYYVLAISWHPGWCATEGAARAAPDCGPDADLGFTLHGLWPQHETGWPEYCEIRAPDPSRRETGAMADIMGSGGLAWYQWKKHGRCSGLRPGAYFDAARSVFASLRLPRLGETDRATAAQIEAALLALNPRLGADGAIVTCRDAQLREIRICLTPSLEPRACARDVLDDACRESDPLAIAEIP